MMGIHPKNFPINREVLLGVIFALLAAVGSSGKAIFIKLAYQDNVDAITLLALRMGFSVPFFIGVAIWAQRRNTAPLNGHDRLMVLGLGLIGYYLSSFLDFIGLQYISAGLERLILFLYPTMTVILSALIYKQPVGNKIISAMALSYFGIILVFFHDVEVKQSGMLLGTALVFASTLSYSAYLVGAGHSIARIGVARFTAYSMVIASLASLLQLALTHPLSAFNLPARVYGLALSMALFSTILPVFLVGYAIRCIGAGRASLIGTVGPVSTIYMAYLFLGESMSFIRITGSVLVMAGVLIISMSATKKVDY